jgi:hypothetical protein
MSELIYRLYQKEIAKKQAGDATAPTPSAGVVPDGKQAADEENRTERATNNLSLAPSCVPDAAATKILKQRAVDRPIYRVEQIDPKVRGHIRNASEFANIGIDLDAPHGRRDPAKAVNIAAPKPFARTTWDYQQVIDEAARRVCRDIPRICEAALNEDDPGVDAYRLMVKIRFQNEYDEIVARRLAIVDTTQPLEDSIVAVPTGAPLLLRYPATNHALAGCGSITP